MGTPVKRFCALLRHPAFVVLPEHGTHELTRIFVWDGKARCSDRADNKIGPCVVQKVDWDPVKGLTVRTDKGYICSPPGDCQVSYEV